MTPWTRSGTASATAGATVAAGGEDGAVASLHVCFAVALVGADGAGTLIHAYAMGKGGCALELGEDGIFVGKEVADEAVGEFFLHCDGRLGAGSEDARRDVVGERGDIVFVR